MSIFVAVVLIFLAILFHEIGHAVALSKRGIVVQELGMGIPLKKVPSISFKLGKLFPETTFRLTPLLIGAYVKHEEEDLKKLSFSDKAAIFGAGIVANIMFAIVLAFIWLIILVTTVAPDPILALKSPSVLKGFAAIFTVGLLTWFCRRWIYLTIPFIGIAVIFLLTITLMGMENPSDGFGGPITIGILTPQYVKGLPDAFFWGALISLSVGLTNALPFHFFDGGRTMNLFLEKVGGPVQRVGVLTGKFGFYTLIVMCLLFDIVHLVEKLMM